MTVSTDTPRRRLAVTALMVMAGAATIATSPGTTPQPSSTLQRSDTVELRIDAGKPSVAGRLLVSIMRNDLPTPSAAIFASGGELTLVVVPGTASRQESGTPIRLSIVDAGDARPTESSKNTANWKLSWLCQSSVSCRRAFDVLLEWTAPPTIGAQDALVVATLSLEYQRAQPPSDMTVVVELSGFGQSSRT